MSTERVYPHYPHHFYLPLRDYFKERNPGHALIISEVLDYYAALYEGRVVADNDVPDKMAFIEDVMTPEFKRSRPHEGCPDCMGLDLVSFDAASGMKKGYLAHMIVKQKLKCGELAECTKCGVQWLYTLGLVTVVPRTQEPIVLDWNRRKLAFPEDILRVLCAIGANPRSEDLVYPCKCRVGGRWMDFCNVSFQSKPPLIYSSGKRIPVIYADEVDAVAPSEYAFSLEARTYLQEGENIGHKEFQPSVLEAKDGRKFLFSARQSFFKYDDCKGSELLVPTGERTGVLPGGPSLDAGALWEQCTTVIADAGWGEGL